MQGAVGSGARGEELTLLQLAEASSCENEVLPAAVSGETTVAESPLQIQDMKYIALSSTPFHKASSPAVPTLTSDSSADWSVSMATPTNLRQPAKRETPLVITTDEEVSDMERTVTKRKPRSLPARGQSVIRTLFRRQSPQCPDPIHSTASNTIQTTPLPFSPISASPLLHCHQRHSSPEAPPTNTSTLSLITVAETPTRPEREGKKKSEREGKKRRSGRESIGLNKGFCEDVTVSSEELFESSAVFPDDTVEVVPDSPLLATVPESPARAEEDEERDPVLAGNQGREEGSNGYEVESEKCDDMEEEAASPNIDDSTKNQNQVSLVRNQIQDHRNQGNQAQINPTINQAQDNTIQTQVRNTPQFRNENKNEIKSNANFLYPTGWQSLQTRGKRKRDGGSSAEPPGKKVLCVAETSHQTPTTTSGSDIPPPLECVAESDCDTRPEESEAEEEKEKNKGVKQLSSVSDVAVSVRPRGGSRAPGLLRKSSSSSERHRPRVSLTSPTTEVATPLPSFAGFQTASGRSLTLSTKSLQNAQKLLSEDVEEPDSNSGLKPELVSTPQLPSLLQLSTGAQRRRSHSAGVVRARGAQAKPFKPPRPAANVSEVEERERVARLLRGMKQAGAGVESGPFRTPSTIECGFSTGSGRKLTVSSSALHRAQQLVACDKENGVSPSHPTPSSSRSTNSISAVSSSASVPLCGFQSASGRALSMSAKAVEKARSLLADIDRESISTDSPLAIPAPSNPLITEVRPGPSDPPLTEVRPAPLDPPLMTEVRPAPSDPPLTEVRPAPSDPPLMTEVRPGPSDPPLMTEVRPAPLDPPLTEVRPAPSDSNGVLSEAQEFSDNFYTRDLAREDLLEFTVFSQFNQPIETVTEREMKNEGERFDSNEKSVDPKVEGEEKREEENGSGEEDCSAYFSTQVVKQFLDFSEMEENDEVTSQQARDETERESLRAEKEEEEEEEEESRTASQTLMDELFGVMSPEPTGGEERESEENGGIAASPAAMEAAEREDNGSSVEGNSNREEKEAPNEATNDWNHSLGDSPVRKSGPLSFPGLMTASGRKVAVSSSALSAARQTLNSAAGPSQEREEGAKISSSVDPQSRPPLGLMTAGGRKVHISEAALQAVRGTATSEEVTREGEKDSGGSLFMGFQTAAGVRVTVSETALAAVKGKTSQSTVTAPPSTTPSITSSSFTDSATESKSRVKPHFRSLTTKPHPLSLKPRPSSSSKPFFRYKPVFRRSQQAPPTQPEALPTATPTPISVDRQPSSHGLQTSLEGVFYDRATSRRPLTPVQTFLGPDGSYMSTPVQRYSVRSVRSLSTSSDKARREGEGEGEMERESEAVGTEQQEKESCAFAHSLSVDIDSVTNVEREGRSNTGSALAEGQKDTSEDMELAVARDGDKGVEEEEMEGVGECAVAQLDDSLDDLCHTGEVPRPPPRRRRRPVRKKMAPRSPGSLLMAHLQQWEARLPLSAWGRPGRHSRRQLYGAGVHPATAAVTADSAISHQFSGDLFFSSAVLEGAPVCVGDGAVLRLSNGAAGVSELWEAFTSSPGVDEKLVSFQWFRNHYRWLVWKSAAMEVAFPRDCGGRWLTPDWLMKQMRYRYDREIEAAERPALRRICERDDVCHRRLVLCVSGVYSGPYSRPPTSESKEGEVGYPSLEVTDGWYSLPAILDSPLQYMLHSGKISVGTKIITCGAKLVGSADACHPLEAPPTLCLRLSANSTRRARWYARLGYQACPLPFCLPLTSLFPDGGPVGCTEAVIARVYPLIYMENVVEGKNVFRNGRAEERAARQQQELRQKKIEEISSKIQRECEEEVTSKVNCRVGWRRSRRLNTLQVKQLQDGEAIHTALTNSPDPQVFQEALSSMQLALLESYHQSLVERRRTELRQRVEEAVRQEEEGGRLPLPHTSTPLLRVRLVPPGSSAIDCQLSVWKPRESVTSVLVEGRLVRMWNLNGSNRRNRSGSLQLTASSHARFEVVEVGAGALSGFQPRECVSIGRLVRGEGVWCGEFDTVGMVVSVISEHLEQQEPPGSSRVVDTVYMADGESNMLAVRVWDGLKHHCLQGLVTPAALVSATSLTFRGPHPSSGHTLSATASDHTHFSQAPPHQHVREGLLLLEKLLPSNRTNYLQSLEDEVMNIHLPLHHH